MIRSLLGDIYIAKVRVPFCTRVTIVDASWFDDYRNARRAHFIEKYWTGVPHPIFPWPEILVEGVVEFTETDQLEHIKKFGKKY